MTSPDAASDAAAPSEPVVSPGELTRVIAELQSRLASLEKQRTQGAAKGRRKTPEKTAGPTTTPAASGEAGTPPLSAADLDARLRELRELESALLVEKLALHTRLKAAEQEEVLIRNETQTLHLKMRSFKAVSFRLREQDAELKRASTELAARQEAFEREKQVVEQGRQEIEQIKTQLEREREAVNREAKATPSAAVAPSVTAAAQATAASATKPTAPSPVRQAVDRVWRLFSVSALGLAAVAAVSIAIAWLTVVPVYRATAAISQPAAAVTDGSSPSGYFNQPILAESVQLLAQRGLRPFDSAEAMAAALDRHMTLRSGAGGALVLSYESPDRETAVFVLDALSRSYVKAHASRGAAVTQAAAADLLPYRDDRWARAVTWFITFVIVAGVLALAAASLPRLLAKRRVAST